MSRRLPPLAALALAPALAACAHDGPTLSRALLDEPGERVAITRFHTGAHPLTHYSGIREPARLVVRDAPMWAATWAAIWNRVTPEPELPPVDFGREMVVVAALGERASGGHAILVDSATLHGPTLRVHVRTIASGPRCVVTAALSQPVDAVRLPRHDGRVEFRERTEVFHCE